MLKRPLFLCLLLTCAPLYRASAQESCYLFSIPPDTAPPDDHLLKDAIRDNPCVQLSEGTLRVLRPVEVDTTDGNKTIKGTLTGVRSTIRVVDSAYWHPSLGGGNYEQTAVISVKSHDTASVLVRDLIIDAGMAGSGNGVPVGATYGIGYGAVNIQNNKITKARCAGVAIAGPNVRVEFNEIFGNGLNPPDAQCYTDPPAAGIYAHGTCSDPVAGNCDPETNRYAPVIDNNTIHDNRGGMIDVDRVSDGLFAYNYGYNNYSWAAVSLFNASGWLVYSNTIAHPSTGMPQHPGHPDCNGGSHGAGPAAIALCEDNLPDYRTPDFPNGLPTPNHHTRDNQIYSNVANSFYGVLLVGYEVFPGDEDDWRIPQKNIVRDNNLDGSLHKCADDYVPTTPAYQLELSNTWLHNNCANPDVPSYF